MIGMRILGLWLIFDNLIPLLGVVVPYWGVIMAIVAIVAGLLILAGQ